MDGVPVHPMRVALVGNPNSGKTALFNALTGSLQKVANYPGVTVETKKGKLKHRGQMIDIMDELNEDSGTPGITAKVIDANGRTQTVSFNLAKIEDLVVQGR